MADESLIEEPTNVRVGRGRVSVRLPGTFRALAYRDYRLLWLGQLLSSASQWMEQVLRPILVLELTDSAIHLGLISAVRLVPQLCVGLIAGAAADRFDRKRILQAAQAAAMAIHLITAFLVLTDRITIWQIYVTTISAGVVMAFNQPARQSFIPTLVPREHLTNAVALNSVALNITRIAGPSAAGVLILPLGIGGVFLLNGGLMLVVVILTSMIAVSFQGMAKDSSSLWHGLGEGISYVAKDRYVLAMVSLTMALFVFGLPYQQVFVPLIAKDVMDIGNAGLGLMISMMGAGALIGALAVASIGSVRNRGTYLIGGAMVFGVSLIAFSLSTWSAFIVLPFIMIAISGAIRMTYMSTSNAFLLEQAPPGMHGRIMSFLSLDRGLVSLGSIFAGFLAAAVGPQWGMAIMGALCIASPLAVAMLFPQLKRMD